MHQEEDDILKEVARYAKLNISKRKEKVFLKKFTPMV
jgi:hypothetical protein